jgi:hypothetical protein
MARLGKSIVENSGALAEKLAGEFGAESDIVAFVRDFELPNDKLLVSTVVEPRPVPRIRSARDVERRFWVVFDAPTGLGYGREVRFAGDLKDLEKLDVGSAKTTGGTGLGLSPEKLIRFFVVRRRDIFAARVVR